MRKGYKAYAPGLAWKQEQMDLLAGRMPPPKDYRYCTECRKRMAKNWHHTYCRRCMQLYAQ